MAEWYVQKGAERVGPVSDEAVCSMARAGQVSPDDLVWTAGMPTWEKAVTQAWFQQSTIGAAPAMQPPAIPQMPQQMPYAQQVPYGQQPIGYGLSGMAPIRNYLPWAIASIILCCMPGGIVATIYASKANSAQAAGDYVAANAHAARAKTWIIVSVVVGLIVQGIYLAAVIGGGLE